MDDSGRLDRLVRAGRLSAVDAADAKLGIDRLHLHSVDEPAGPRPPAGNSWSALRWRFLRREVDEAALRAGARRLAASFALGVGLLTFVFDLAEGWFAHGSFRASFQEASISANVLGAALAGLLLYGLVLRPQLRKTINFGNELGEPIESLPAFRLHQCPTCGAENAAPANNRLLRWLWVLAPPPAVNEVIFGQRVPRDMERCLECGAQFIACSGCRQSVEAGDVRHRWARLLCANCGAPFRALRNVLGWLITAPFGAVGALAGLWNSRGDTLTGRYRE